MRSALGFLVAAKRCEIGELAQLALTGTLVKVVGRPIHELQRERGMSNVFLASQGKRSLRWKGEACLAPAQNVQCGASAQAVTIVSSSSA